MLKIFVVVFFLGFLRLDGHQPFTPPSYGHLSVFIPYSNALRNKDLDKSPKINVGFNGNKHHTPFTMDTGSVGIVASADIFTPAPDAKNLGPGRLIYSSSGIIEEGTWWSATQAFYDAEGHIIATSNVPVLQVTSVKCKKNARFCEPKKHPKGIAMMGIGFARESPTQLRGTPNYNPFLNLQLVLQNGVLKKLPDDWTNGYVVSRHGVFLGLTPKNTAHAGFVKLEPWEEYSTKQLPEWKAVPMTIKVNGTSGNGHILMDTGVGTAYLTPPENANLGKLQVCRGSKKPSCLSDGTVIDVYIPNENHPVFNYSFKVGDESNPMRPQGVHIVKHPQVFLNTSRHVFSKMSLIYDNTHGYIGYIRNE